MGSLGYRNDEFAPVMDLMASGAIRVEPMHDATVPLEEAADAFAALAADPAHAIKVLVDPRTPDERGPHPRLTHSEDG